MARPLRAAGKFLALVSLVLVASLLRETVSGAQVHLEPGEQAVVFGVGPAGLAVREGPGRWFPVLAVIPENTEVTVVEGPTWSGSIPWYQLSGFDGEGRQGWSAGNYLQPKPEVNLETGESGGRDRQASFRGGERSGSFIAMVTGYSIQGRTASGVPTHWGIVAVDPGVVPLGSKIQIDGFEDTFVAADTGGGVNGSWIDIWFPTYAEARQFGTQARRVTIVE